MKTIIVTLSEIVDVPVNGSSIKAFRIRSTAAQTIKGIRFFPIPIGQNWKPEHVVTYLIGGGQVIPLTSWHPGGWALYGDRDTSACTHVSVWLEGENITEDAGELAMEVTIPD